LRALNSCVGFRCKCTVCAYVGKQLEKDDYSRRNDIPKLRRLRVSESGTPGKGLGERPSALPCKTHVLVSNPLSESRRGRMNGNGIFKNKDYEFGTWNIRTTSKPVAKKSLLQ
jgi:hypothetical protein